MYEYIFHRSVHFDKLWLKTCIKRYFGRPVGGATDCLTEQQLASTIFNILNGASWHLFAIILLTDCTIYTQSTLYSGLKKSNIKAAKIKKHTRKPNLQEKKGQNVKPLYRNESAES